MTNTEYADYKARFNEGMTGLSHFSSGSWMAECDQCPTDVEYEDGVCYDAEPYFSWSRCEICDSIDSGDREDCHAILDGGGLIHLRVCIDCVYFAEYSRLPNVSFMTTQD